MVSMMLYKPVLLGLLVGAVTVFVVHGEASHAAADLPQGHMLAFGEHRAAEGNIAEEDDFVDPPTFYNKYLKPGVPVIFKGAAKQIPAFKLWQDQYLKKEYGKLQVSTEIAKKENRTKGVKYMSMTKFLNTYENSDIYMVQDVIDPMKKDLVVPKPLVCGGYESLLAASVIWFSSGGTKSVLHNDDIENINCLMDGSKRFIMIDKKFKDRIEGQHFVYRRGYSKVDVDKVDMLKFPGLQQIPWWEVHMSKGDCLYIPLGWYHIVHSAGPRNLAVNTWFRPMQSFDSEGCHGNIPEALPLEDFEFRGLESYTSEQEEDEMEEQSELSAENIFWEFRSEQKIKKDDFRAVYMQEALDWEMDVVFLILDLNKDGTLTWDELVMAKVDALLTLFPFLSPLPMDIRDSKPEKQDDKSVKDEL